MKRIKEIKIENSSFFKEDFRISFHNKLNCIMGGRGTGKSTILHMISATLDDSTESDKTTYGILKNNLGDGKIVLLMEAENGKTYEISKTFNEEPLALLDTTKEHVSFSKILEDIKCDIYRASEIEQIGLNSRSRLALIDKMLKGEVDNLYREIEEEAINIKGYAHSLKTENTRVNQIKNSLKEYDGAEKEFDDHKKQQPKDIIKEEKEKFEKADNEEKVRAVERQFVNKLELEIKALLSSCETQKNSLIDAISNKLKSDNLINFDILNPLILEIRESYTGIIDSHEKDIAALKVLLEKISDLSVKLADRHSKQQAEFVALKQTFEKNKVYYTQYNKLSKRLHTKKELQKSLEELEGKRLALKEKRKELVSAFNIKKKEIFNKRYEKVQALNEEFKGSIKITLTFSGITNEFEDALQKAFRGSNMRYNTIIPNIIINFTPDKFAEIIHSKDRETLMNVVGVDEERSQAILDLLYESDHIYEIETIYCPDLPEFLLKIDRKGQAHSKDQQDFKKTDELSTGQRCTTILPIIFAVSKNPLLIDQPEDNLDNEYISGPIHEMIKDEKNKRQLIFITHNPNIPVLSDAEYNLFLSYFERKSSIDTDGDVPSVKQSILDLLEGGQEAFDKRKSLYGDGIADGI